jgi:predicted cupin superfamily sugar epimerase
MPIPISMTADEVKKMLGLAPHPCEGGWYVRTYESGEMLASSAFAAGRYAGARHTGTAIYYLLEPGTFSEMHRLRSDEIFHFYAGDPVEMLQLHEDGSGDVARIGNNLVAGERPQVVVPRGVWQGSRLVPEGEWALLGCTVSPGFEFDDYETGVREELCIGWPAFSQLICQLTRLAGQPGKA